MTQLDLADSEVGPSPTKLGRKRDHSRDPEILEITLDVLAEVGYDGMTLDMVAARAKAGKATLYRRWPSKADLVVDAVACMKTSELDPNDLPDTGTLRGDLLAIMKAPSIKDGERKIKVMAGVVSLLSNNPDMAEVLQKAIVQPRAAINRALFERAIARGEIPADSNVAMLSIISPSMAAYRNLMLRKPVTREFLVSVMDEIILPAVGLRAR